MYVRDRSSAPFRGSRHLLAVVLAAVCFLAVSAAFPLRAEAYTNGYYIKSYDVNITVNEDNTFDVVETLQVYFDEGMNKHGIIRTIPLTNHVVREDGTSSTNRVVITGIDVDYYDYAIETGSGDYRIRIGNRNLTVEGDVTYVIRYNYDIGADPLKGKDEFYYNIIGPQWDTEIDSVDFHVSFPEEFDPSSLGFAVGSMGSTETGVFYKVEGNTVDGYYHEVLDPYSGLTMRMELPEGYFKREAGILKKLGDWLMALPVVGFLLAVLLYRKRGRNEKPVEPVEFYPPDDLDPLEIGYIDDCTVDDRDITALLIHLANKGYVEVQDDGGGYQLRLLRDRFDEDNLQEQMFYEGLQKYAQDGVVKDTDLEDNFYKVVQKIRRSYLTREKKRSIIAPSFGTKFLIILLGMLIIFTSLFLLVYTTNYSIRMAAFIGAAGAMLVGFYLPFLVYAFNCMNEKASVAMIVIVIVIGHFLIMSGSIGVVALNGMGVRFSPHMLLYLGGVVLGIIASVLGVKARRLTEYGNRMLGRVRGFRNFLELAEKPKLEEL
ncbi:MAG: DUF2207 domain-containing protein, partial [Mogibacterium sp.]|nr:DUF2207 domain-containing protein [Mogibacterium sp.]